MRTYECKLQSVTPVAFGRFYSEEVTKGPKESHEDYEKRTWKNRAHANNKGNVVIPPLAFKNALTAIAKYLGEKIPGQRNATYTKHFMSGVLVTDPLTLPIKRDDLKGQWIHVPADGVRGGSKRVLKCFPVVDEWEGSLKVTILDETITEEVLKRHLIEAGNFIGVGSLRVQNNGIYGRFKVVDMKQVSA